MEFEKTNLTLINVFHKKFKINRSLLSHAKAERALKATY